MRGATYTLMMAALTGTGHALLAFRSEHLTSGWLEGIVTQETTIGGAAVLPGMWTAGVASTIGGGVGMAWMTWAFWRHRQLARHRPNPQATGAASP